MLKSRMIAVGLLSLVVACGAKKSSNNDENSAEKTTDEVTNTNLAKLDSSAEVMDYAITALSSSGKNAATTALNLDGDGTTEQQSDAGDGSSQGSTEGSGEGSSSGDDPVHEKHALCSRHGGAYKADGSGRMSPTEAGFSERTLYCQLNVADSPDTIIGSLSQAKKILCTVEKSVGKKIEYAAAGKKYSNVKLKFDTSCGWRDEEVGEMKGMDLTAEFIGTSFASGDWQKSVQISLPAAGVDFKMFYTVKGDVVAIKKVEGWNQKERCSKGESSCNKDVIPEATKGSRGDVIALDLKSGELRAETTDNYWGRRARAYFVGTLDAATGSFKSLNKINFIYTDMYLNKSNDGALYVSGQVASAKGTTKDGVAFVGGAVVCSDDASTMCTASNISSVGKVKGPGVECSVSGGCKGNTGFNWAFSNSKVVDFIRLGAGFDSYSGSRAKNEAWLKDAKIPKFTSVEISPVVE